MCVIILSSLCVCVCVRYAYPGESVVGHTADVGKRTALVFLCLLYLWDHWCTAVVGASAEPLLSGGKLHTVSLYTHAYTCESVCL